MRRHPRAVALAGAAALALLAGCGGSGGGEQTSSTATAGTTAPATTASAAYRTSVEAATAALLAFRNLEERVTASTLRRNAKALAAARLTYAKKLEAVAALTPPPGLATAHSKLLTSGRAVGKTLTQMVRAARKNDPEAFLTARARLGAALVGLQAAAEAFAGGAASGASTAAAATT